MKINERYIKAKGILNAMIKKVSHPSKGVENSLLVIRLLKIFVIYSRYSY